MILNELHMSALAHPLSTILESFYSCEELHHLAWSVYAQPSRSYDHAKEALTKALQSLDGAFNPNTVEDWYSIAAQCLDIGHGQDLIATVTEQGLAKNFSPYLEAINAHLKGTAQYLDNIPVEVQSVACTIYTEIECRRESA